MFGDRLAFLRKQKQITQAQLSSEIGVARSSIASYERGNRQPDFATLLLIADYFEVSLDYLLGRDYFRETNERYYIDVLSELSPRDKKIIEVLIENMKKDPC